MVWVDGGFCTSGVLWLLVSALVCVLSLCLGGLVCLLWLSYVFCVAAFGCNAVTYDLE